MVTRNGYISRRASDPRIPLLVELQAQGHTVVTRLAGMRASARVHPSHVRVSNYASVSARSCTRARLRIYS